MKILELFAGTQSFSNVAKQRGHEIFTIDINPKFNCSLTKDIMDFDMKDIPFIPDIIWLSPPCQSFSVASIGKNWNLDGTPKTKKAMDSIKLLEKAIQIVNEIKPKYFFIENPRGMMRKLEIMKQFKRNTVTYCQYGDKRMKPTDIWTNHKKWTPKSPCKNKGTCHVSAPRGSRTGTQGLKDATERGVIPTDLCKEILESIENDN